MGKNNEKSQKIVFELLNFSSAVHHKYIDFTTLYGDNFGSITKNKLEHLYTLKPKKYMVTYILE